MLTISKRAASFPESVIREMTRQHALYGGVNLAQGYPDFDPPPEIVEAAAKALRDGYNQYAITWGAPQLRDAIARTASAFNRLPTDPQANVTVTCGAKEAMIATLEKWVPITAEAFRQYRLGGAQLSANALAVVKKLLAGEKVTQESSGLSKREWTELMEALGTNH